MWPRDCKRWVEAVLGEEVGFRAAYREFRRCRYTSSLAEENSRECEQDALLVAVGKTTEPAYFKSEAHFRNWVRQTGRNKARDVIRRDLRRGERSLMPGSHEKGESRTYLDELLEPLSEEDRRIVVFVIVEGHSYDEAAERFEPKDGRSDSARKMSIYRQVRRILGHLRQWMFDNLGPDACFGW